MLGGLARGRASPILLQMGLAKQPLTQPAGLPRAAKLLQWVTHGSCTSAITETRPDSGDAVPDMSGRGVTAPHPGARGGAVVPEAPETSAPGRAGALWSDRASSRLLALLFVAVL